MNDNGGCGGKDSEDDVCDVNCVASFGIFCNLSVSLLRYFCMIFRIALLISFQGNTLISFSIFRVFGFVYFMSCVKNRLEVPSFLTVSGLNPSRLRRMRFFSWTSNGTGESKSRSMSKMMSTDVKTHVPLSL